VAEKNKFYVVWVGKKPGVYITWADCQLQVKGFPGALFKSFTSEEEAFAAFKGEEGAQNKHTSYERNSVSVDAACSGNPGIMEFQGVDTESGELLFHYGPYPLGTNNIGEFLGIVSALQMLQKENSQKMIYSDSQTALAWVRNKKVASNLVRNQQTKELWDMTDAALEWLERNPYKNPLLKWDTVSWGENKSDFGNK
jgi:ribonuclease HI